MEYDKEVMKRLQNFSPDLCLLAGYMLIIGEEMCQKYDMINLHPALPGGPVGSWQEVIWTLVKNKAKETGVMIHLVTPELDRGPVVTYCTFPIEGEPFDRYWREMEKGEQNKRDTLFQLIRQYELAREFPLITATLKAFSQGKIKIQNGEVVNAEKKSISGYNLTNEINQIVKAKLK